MEYIHFEELPAQSGLLGVITLNRPQALNALNHEMINVLYNQLAAWSINQAIVAVVIKSNSERAFSAGGDIRALYQAPDRAIAMVKFFHDEYRLNYLIGSYPKPYIALLNGIVMGGGAGISIHGSHRVACESLIFAMPETAIGLFPDIGSSHFLNQAPGYLGSYLGLSGARIHVADACYAKLVDYCISSNYFNDVVEALRQAVINQASAHEDVAAILNDFAIKPDESAFRAQQDYIDGLFCFDDMSMMMDALQRDDGEWARAVHVHLSQKSPTSLMLTLALLKRARHKDLASCLKQDFFVGQTIVTKTDFYEGIRATIIDEDMKPQWQPSSLEAISDEQIEAYFNEQGKQALQLN